MLLVVVAPTTVESQQPALIQRAETEIWTRLRERAAQSGTLMLDGSDLDLRIPLDGEPEEVIGVTRLTNWPKSSGDRAGWPVSR